MDPGVWVAIIVACSAFIGSISSPIVSALLISRGKREDYARQDLVAARVDAAAEKAAQAAELLAAAQQETIRRTNEVARVAEQTAIDTSGKLDTIHHLVNSSMTAAMMGELGAVGRELTMMREVVELRRGAGHAPSTDALAAITATEAKLAELEAAVADRERQTAIEAAKALE